MGKKSLKAATKSSCSESTADVTFSRSSSLVSSNVVQLSMPKCLKVQNATAKIIPVTETKPRQLLVPAETKISIFSPDGELESVSISDFLSSSGPPILPDTTLSLPTTKVVRPPVPLLAACKSIPLKRISSSPFLPCLPPKKIRSLRPKRSPKLSEKCRLCGTLEGKMINIFSPMGDRIKIADKISTLLPISIDPADKLPLKVCTACNTSLEAAYSFYVTCVETDSALKIQLVAESSENARKRQYIPLILSDHIDVGVTQFSKKSEPNSFKVVDEQLVSISKTIPKKERVAQVVEAVKAGLGVQVPILEKTNCAEDAFALLSLPVSSTSSNQFLCSKCNTNLSNSFELMTHELLKFRCSKCHQRFCTPRLRRKHNLENHQTPPSCNECCLNFSSKGRLRSHLELKPFICDCCDLGFHSKISLQDHLINQFKNVENKVMQNPEDTLGQMWHCEPCDRIFFDKFRHEQHSRQHDPEYLNSLTHKCTICPRAFSNQSQLNRHLDEHFKVKKHQCKVCAAQFTTSSRLALHMDLHSDSKFICAHCSAQSLHKIHLARHVKLKHLMVSLFRCNICQENFPTRLEVSNHCSSHLSKAMVQFRNETQDKPIFSFVSPFKCPICGGCKASSDLLKRHLDMHRKRGEGGGPRLLNNRVECNICHKDFTNQSNLKIHITMAHVRSQSQGVKKSVKNYYKYKCSKCPKAYKMERDLLDHDSAIHLNILLYSCDFCSAKFPANANKKVHMFGKKVQSSYPCAVCLKTFPTKCQRNHHQQEHEKSSTKNIKCSFCEESFSKMAQLYGHLGKRHPHQVTKNIYCDICGKGFNTKPKFNKHYNSHFALLHSNTELGESV